MTEFCEEVYLGDGLYASYDGWQFMLRAPRGGRNDCVFLEPEVYQEFVRYASKRMQETEKTP